MAFVFRAALFAIVRARAITSETKETVRPLPMNKFICIVHANVIPLRTLEERRYCQS